jgi:hypothetical protein
MQGSHASTLAECLQGQDTSSARRFLTLFYTLFMPYYAEISCIQPVEKCRSKQSLPLLDVSSCLPSPHPRRYLLQAASPGHQGSCSRHRPAE